MKELVEKHRILQCQVGSQVYGTATPESDTDYSGIFIAPKRFYLGLDKVEEVDLSVVSKHTNGKNDKNAIDSKYYEIRKFMKLAMENNPNILEHLFIPEQNIVFWSPAAGKLFRNAHIFPHAGLKQKFLGYAFSQKHKMLVKPENYAALDNFKVWYENHSYQTAIKDMPVHLINGPGFNLITFSKDFATIGDLNFNLTVKLKDVYEKVCARLNKAGSRTEIFLKHGYDTKFGMHLVRLMLEGKELLETGKIEFPLKSAPMLLDIRNGRWKQTEIIEFAEQMEAEITDMKTFLPPKPNYNEIENLLIDMVQEHWERTE